MAIKLSMDFCGKTFPDAYHRILESFMVNTSSKRIGVNTEVYYSEIERRSGENAFTSGMRFMDIPLTPEEKDTIFSLIYSALKRLDYFSEGQDV